MGKELSEMSLEELWELFPVSLVPHNDKWNIFYDEMEAFLKTILSECPIERISHIGSTAIFGIWAKDIVDVLIEVSRDADIQNTAKIIENSGFICMSTEENRVSFNRGYTKDGFADKVFHVHLRYAGDNDELYFRDYLNDNPQTAKEYEAMKLQLWKQYEHDRDSYTNAKTDFIKKIDKGSKKNICRKILSNIDLCEQKKGTKHLLRIFSYLMNVLVKNPLTNLISKGIFGGLCPKKRIYQYQALHR